MAQHDFDIANGSGATVRADLNAALEALATTSSGATAPSVTFPNMWWHDTTAGILKRRNPANTAWISVANIAGSALTFVGATIMDAGSNGNGNYITFTSGLQICWKTLTAQGPITTAQGTGQFVSAAINPGSFARGFSSPPNVLFTSWGSVASYVQAQARATNGAFGVIQLVRGVSSALTDFGVDCVAIGMA